MLRVGLLSALCALMSAPSYAQPDRIPYYQGKRLTVLINFAPGGGVDISGRLFARFLAKHLAGNPNVIVQNVDGAAGINGVNYLGEIAPKDGTVIGYLGATPWQFVSSPQRFRVDFRTYEFVAFEPITNVFVIRTDVAPGIKIARDIVRVQKLVSGGLGATHARDLNIRLTLDMLGVPYRHVTGYSSTERARLALQRGEIQFTGETTPGYRGPLASLVASGEIVPVYYNPGWDGKTLSIPRQVHDLPIQPFHELFRELKGDIPTGPLWEAYLANLALTSTMARLYALPPGSPTTAVGELREAIRRLNHDSEFAAQSNKVVGYLMESEFGDDTNHRVRTALSVRPDIIEFVNDYLKRK